MSDMASTIIPKSDQMNADDLIAGPITITVTGVTIRSGGEQPISIHYEGDGGKPYKACKSMCRVLVTAWGPDSKAYVGRSMTLYRDPAVTWAGMAVGGIRISHMSDIDSKITMALTATKQSRKPYTVRPLEAAGKNPAAPNVMASPMGEPAPTGAPETHRAGASDAAATITPDEALALEARCTDNNISVAKLKEAAKVERISAIKPADLPRAHEWVDKVLAARKAKQVTQ